MPNLSDSNYTKFLFLMVFSRFEYAMKKTAFLMNNEDAKADWNKLKNQAHLSENLTSNEILPNSVSAILFTPPNKQVVVNEKAIFVERPLDNRNGIAAALEATKRIRNNLFHGGKSNEDREQRNRNDSLINYGLIVLREVLNEFDEMKNVFEEGFEFIDDLNRVVV